MEALHFNSHPHAGGDPLTNFRISLVVNFNSHPHAGGDPRYCIYGTPFLKWGDYTFHYRCFDNDLFIFLYFSFGEPYSIFVSSKVRLSNNNHSFRIICFFRTEMLNSVLPVFAQIVEAYAV